MFLKIMHPKIAWISTNQQQKANPSKRGKQAFFMNNSIHFLSQSHGGCTLLKKQRSSAIVTPERNFVLEERRMELRDWDFFELIPVLYTELQSSFEQCIIKRVVPLVAAQFHFFF